MVPRSLPHRVAIALIAVIVSTFPVGLGGQVARAEFPGQMLLERGSSAATSHPELVRNARPQPGWRRFTGPVPILVYHALGNPPPGAPFPELYVSGPGFRSQMAWLAMHGYQAVTLNEVERAWYHHGTLPRKPIVITFDNGYPAQATFAPAVLGRYGWRGVLFEITEHHLDAARIRPLIARGWEVDSHSATHPDLTTLTGSALTFQVAGSRRFLQRTYRVPSNTFCYPSSEYDAATIAAVRAAGYTAAVTEIPGYATRTRPFQLDRFEIERGQGVSGLEADLNWPR
jgi:peptidoglycan/xylan/chitin deacetylase (PgdA/CDA1 family)